MSINIDEVIDSLPENLMFKADSCEIVANENLSPNTVWGPFDVEKCVMDVVNQSQMWSKIKILSCDWVNFLVDKAATKLSQVTNRHTSGNNEEWNTTLTFSKKEFQATISTNEEITIGNVLNCTLVVVDQLPSKVQSHIDPSSENDHNNEKLTKSCKFCGINFSHQCTLDAHMTYYCSKRQSVLTESNPSPKCQKTWRTRQRNKQINNQKINNNITSAVLNSNMFLDDSNQFQILDRNISSKLLLSTIAGSEALLNVHTTPIVSHTTIPKKPVLLTNGNAVSGQPGDQGEKLSNQIGNNSDSESENGASNSLRFCAPCGLFFSNKELYNIHIQLDVTNFQSSIAKCNSLVLAAPVFNHNGLQYVPIHPRTAVLNPPTTLQSHTKKSNVNEDQLSSVPLDLSINNSSKSPIDRLAVDVANRMATVANLAASNCNNLLRSNKRPFLCQHCQTRFQLYSTFQAHQEFYCQGKRHQQQPQPIEVADKRCRTSNNNLCQSDFEISSSKAEDVSWKCCNQGFKCEGCGFIGQTKRGIRIHCKNQCFKRLSDQRHETRCEEVERNSSPCDVWPVNNNVSVTPECNDHPTLCHQDSPVKIESV